jgi:hypothetical protein
MVARGFGAAVLRDLAFKRDRFGIGLIHHPRKRSRQYAGLAARVDRDDGRTFLGHAFDRCRQLGDRPGERPCDQNGERRCGQHGN